MCGLCDSPIFGSVDRVDRDSFFKLLRSPGFDSKETIPPGWESIPGLLKRFTNRGSSGPVRQPYSTRFIIAPLDCYKIPAQSARLSLQSSEFAPLANSPVSKCCPPLWCQGGEGHTRWRERGEPIRTKGQTLWYSTVYSLYG